MLTNTINVTAALIRLLTQKTTQRTRTQFLVLIETFMMVFFVLQTLHYGNLHYCVLCSAYNCTVDLQSSFVPSKANCYTQNNCHVTTVRIHVHTCILKLHIKIIYK